MKTRKPKPEVIFLSDDGTYSGSVGTLVVTTDGKVYDLDSLLQSIPTRVWSKWRLRPGDDPTRFACINAVLHTNDPNFTGLQ